MKTFIFFMSFFGSFLFFSCYEFSNKEKSLKYLNVGGDRQTIKNLAKEIKDFIELKFMGLGEIISFNKKDALSSIEGEKSIKIKLEATKNNLDELKNKLFDYYKVQVPIDEAQDEMESHLEKKKKKYTASENFKESFSSVLDRFKLFLIQNLSTYQNIQEIGIIIKKIREINVCNYLENLNYPALLEVVINDLVEATLLEKNEKQKISFLRQSILEKANNYANDKKLFDDYNASLNSFFDLREMILDLEKKNIKFEITHLLLELSKNPNETSDSEVSNSTNRSSYEENSELEASDSEVSDPTTDPTSNSMNGASDSVSSGSTIDALDEGASDFEFSDSTAENSDEFFGSEVSYPRAEALDENPNLVNENQEYQSFFETDSGSDSDSKQNPNGSFLNFYSSE